ncbi:MAG: hypothetical protein WCE52_02030 [Candidatus Acidiferrum sp.]
MVIVIVVIPVTIGVPTMVIFIPPTMAMLPAIFAGFVKFTAVFGSFWAVPAVVFYGFVKVVIGPCDAFLTIVVIGTESRRAKGEEERAKSCSSQETFGRLPTETVILSHGFSKIDLHATPGETRQVNARAHRLT